MNHDPLCRYGWNPLAEYGACDCAVITKTRADERERHTVNNPMLLADLRAKVEALPRSGIEIPYAKGLVRRADVLALIDGASDD